MPDGVMTPQNAAVDGAFEYLKKRVTESSVGRYREGFFRVVKVGNTIYVDKPKDQLEPEMPGYGGQILATIHPPFLGRSGQYYYSGRNRNFAPDQTEDVLKWLGDMIDEDIREWALP